MPSTQAIPRFLFKVIFWGFLFPFGISSCDRTSNAATSVVTTSNATTSIVTNGSSGISISATAARSSGTAPLFVFFDATATTDPSKTAAPFHELNYKWDFGDPSGSPVSGTTWPYGTGNRSRNIAYGPLAGHVFENVGSFHVTLTVTDSAGSSSSTVATITVADPNTTFSGTNTYCVAPSGSTPVGGNDGCPSGATGMVNADACSVVNNYARAGKRILFKHDAIFSCTGAANLTTAGPGLIGMYGSGAKPIFNNSNGGNMFYVGNGANDWRIMDLNMHQTTVSGASIAVNIDGINTRDILTLRTVATGMSGSIQSYFGTIGPTDQIWNHIAYVDNVVSNVADTGSAAGLYFGGEELFIAGNNIDNGGLSQHTIRIWYSGKGVFSNNRIANAAATKHEFKMHAPTWGGAYVNGIGGGYTRWNIISDNQLYQLHNNYSMDVAPQNNASDERVKDIIIERNMVTANGNASDAAVLCSCVDSTIRNNLINVQNTTSTIGIGAGTRGIEPPTSNVKIYNNTVYGNNTSFAGAIEVNSSAAGNVMRNNLVYAPSSSGSIVTDTNSNSTKDHNSTSLSASATFAASPPVNPLDYKPTCTGTTYPCGQGTAVPTYLDLFGADANTSRDLGAINH